MCLTGLLREFDVAGLTLLVFAAITGSMQGPVLLDERKASVRLLKLNVLCQMRWQSFTPIRIIVFCLASASAVRVDDLFNTLQDAHGFGRRFKRVVFG